MARPSDACGLFGWFSVDRHLLRKQHQLSAPTYRSLEHGYWFRFHRWGFYPGDSLALI